LKARIIVGAHGKHREKKGLQILQDYELGLEIPLEKPLSERELECLQLYSFGLQSDQVARVMGVSGETVKAFTRSARNKLTMHTTTGAVCCALRRELIV
jgi:DNA-binding CsgD family transcriptional regulator